MKELTPRQHEIVAFIQAYLEEKSYPPTFREIATHFAISVRGVNDHIVALKKKGRVNYQAGSARTLELLSAPVVASGSVDVPFFKDMAETTLSQLKPNYVGPMLAVPVSMLQNQQSCFSVRMTQESLPELGLCSGDILVFTSSFEIKDQQVVLALLQDGYEVRQYFDEGHRIRLGLGSSLAQACYVDQPTILGVLLGMIRIYEK